MFAAVLASNPVGGPWTRALTAALIFHILLIAAAVSRTATPSASMRLVARDTIRLELVHVPPTAADGPPSDTGPIVAAPLEVPDLPLDPPQFQRLPFTYRPPGAPEFNPGPFQRSSGDTVGSPDSMPLVLSTTEVDAVPEVISQPYPRYPDGLRRAGVSGQVQLQFIVGIDGRVDEGSVRVVVSSHPGFMLSALQALRGSRFKPARRGGRPTAALVQQTIRFSYR